MEVTCYPHLTRQPNRVTPEPGKYIHVPDKPLSIDEGLNLINECKRREDKAWLFVLRNRWNIGLVGTHLNVIYGGQTMEKYSDRLEMPITTVRECIQLVKKFNGDVELYEGFITTGKAKRWIHIQRLIRSNIDPTVLGPDELANRLLAMMEENNRNLAAVNDLARRLPPAQAEDLKAQANGVETAFTEECQGFVSEGHKCLVTPPAPGSAPTPTGDGFAGSSPKSGVVVTRFVLVNHNTGEVIDNIRAANEMEAHRKALSLLGFKINLSIDVE